MSNSALEKAAPIIGFIGWLAYETYKAYAERLDPAQVRALVDKVNAEEFGGWFDPALVMGIIATESSFRPNVHRLERNVWGPGKDDASIGLMQPLLAVARDRGFIGAPGALYDPETNIRIGMRHLKWSYDFLSRRLGAAPTMAQWISSYNAGVGYVSKGGLRLAYVGKVQKAMKSYG